MKQIIVIHYGELILKGANRRFFERMLRKNIRIALQGTDYTEIQEYGKMLLELPEDVTVEQQADFIERLRLVAGITVVFPAIQVSTTEQSILETVFEVLKKKEFNTFGVRLKRTSKAVLKKSTECEREWGGAILERFPQARVNLTDPDIWVRVYADVDSALISVERYKGMGGLPVGTSGIMLSLLSSGIDSPVASQMMMKRGAFVRYIHFHSYPLTSKASIENVEDIIQQLHTYQPAAVVYHAPLAEMQKMIATQAPPKLRVILYRRAMLQIADQFAEQIGAKGLITGESLGQVASQTIENMSATSADISRPLFRPLIGMDKEEIMNRARDIGTYDISIRPYEDCCSLLMPPSVEIKAKKHEVEEIIAGLPWQEYIEQVIAGIEQKRVK